MHKGVLTSFQFLLAAVFFLNGVNGLATLRTSSFVGPQHQNGLQPSSSEFESETGEAVVDDSLFQSTRANFDKILPLIEKFLKRQSHGSVAEAEITDAILQSEFGQLQKDVLKNKPLSELIQLYLSWAQDRAFRVAGNVGGSNLILGLVGDSETYYNRMQNLVSLANQSPPRSQTVLTGESTPSASWVTQMTGEAFSGAGNFLGGGSSHSKRGGQTTRSGVESPMETANRSDNSDSVRFRKIDALVNEMDELVLHSRQDVHRNPVEANKRLRERITGFQSRVSELNQDDDKLEGVYERLQELERLQQVANSNDPFEDMFYGPRLRRLNEILENSGFRIYSPEYLNSVQVEAEKIRNEIAKEQKDRLGRQTVFANIPGSNSQVDALTPADLLLASIRSEIPTTFGDSSGAHVEKPPFVVGPTANGNLPPESGSLWKDITQSMTDYASSMGDYLNSMASNMWNSYNQYVPKLLQDPELTPGTPSHKNPENFSESIGSKTSSDFNPALFSGLTAEFASKKTNTAMRDDPTSSQMKSSSVVPGNSPTNKMSRGFGSEENANPSLSTGTSVSNPSGVTNGNRLSTLPGNTGKIESKGSREGSETSPASPTMPASFARPSAVSSKEQRAKELQPDAEGEALNRNEPIARRNTSRDSEGKAPTNPLPTRSTSDFFENRPLANPATVIPIQAASNPNGSIEGVANVPGATNTGDGAAMAEEISNPGVLSVGRRSNVKSPILFNSTVNTSGVNSPTPITPPSYSPSNSASGSNSAILGLYQPSSIKSSGPATVDTTPTRTESIPTNSGGAEWEYTPKSTSLIPADSAANNVVASLKDGAIPKVASVDPVSPELSNILEKAVEKVSALFGSGPKAKSGDLLNFEAELTGEVARELGTASEIDPITGRPKPKKKTAVGSSVGTSPKKAQKSNNNPTSDGWFNSLLYGI